MNENNVPKAVLTALSALRENHQWHKDYDDHGGYDESELAAVNTHAIERLEAFAAAPVAQHPAPSMDDAIAAGDGTLHGAIGYWQGRALAAEAARDVDETNKVLADNYLKLTAQPPAQPAEAAAQRLAIALDMLDWLSGYPDFTAPEGELVGTAIAEAIAGRTPKMLSDIGYLAQGVRPPATQPLAAPMQQAEAVAEIVGFFVEGCYREWAVNPLPPLWKLSEGCDTYRLLVYATPPTQPVARDALSDDQIAKHYAESDLQPQLYDKAGMFEAGVRFAERHHGIEASTGEQP